MAEAPKHKNKFGEFVRYVLGMPRSIYVNFRCLPFRQAIHLPILVSHRTRCQSLRGKITITGPLKVGLVKIGLGTSQVVDFWRERTLIDLRGKVNFGGKCKIGAGSRIFVAESGTLSFSDNFHNSSHLTILCFKSITFGYDNGQSWHNTIMDSDQHAILDSDGKRINEDAPIIFGNRVWCGCHSTILKGTVVADNIIIGANSCVSGRHLESHVILAGNPAKVVKSGVDWE